MRRLPGLLLAMVMVVVTLPAAAQPAPPPPECPEGQVYSNELGACVPPDQLPPTPTPADTGESTLPIPDEPDTQEEIEEELAIGDMGYLTSFTLQHFACAAGFDPAANAGRWTALRTNCTVDGTPAFTYTIYEEGSTLASPTLTSGGGAWGEQRFATDIEEEFFIQGRLSVTVQAPAGWYLAFVTCQSTRGGAAIGSYNPPVSDNSAFIDEGRIGSDVSCAFFLAQDGAGTTAGNAGTAEAAITITLRSCPDGTTAASDLAATCTGRDTRSTFHIQTETETINSRTVDTSGVATLTFPGDTEVAVTEDLPPGYGQPIVFCAGTAQDVLFGNQIRVSVPAGSILRCQWYDIPTAGPDNGPSIFIRPVDCGPTTRPDEILANAEAACTLPFANLTFDVSLDGELVADDIAPTGPDALVFLTRLPISELGSAYVVTANLPRGASSQRAFCDRGTQESGFSVIDPQFQGNTIAAWADPGQTLRCTWFFRTAGAAGGQGAEDEAAPEEAGFEPGIVIVSRLCPNDVIDSRVDWNVVCTEPGAGIAVTLTRDGSPVLALATGADGLLPVPGDLPSGTYAITAPITTELLGPQIDCSATSADGTTTGTTAYLPDEPAGATFSWDGTNAISCTVWYVVQDPANSRSVDPGQGIVAGTEEEPAPDGAASTLTVQIWLCPTGVEVSAPQEDLLFSCTADLESRTVSVTVAGITTDATITGTATWTSANGIFAIVPGPDVPAGTVWCSASWVDEDGAGADFPEVITSEGGTLTYAAAHAGSTIYCDWFLATE